MNPWLILTIGFGIGFLVGVAFMAMMTAAGNDDKRAGRQDG